MNQEDTETKLKELLEEIRPFLNLDGGDIEYIKLPVQLHNEHSTVAKLSLKKVRMPQPDQ